MFEKLGGIVSRHPWWFLVLWPLAGLLIIWLCPSLSEETREGMSARLPARFESFQVDQKLAAQFKGYDIDSSDLIVLVHREGGLQKKDLEERIPKIIEKLKEYQYTTMENNKRKDIPAVDPDILSALKDPTLARRLTSDDGSTTIIAARLRTIFVSSDTRRIVSSVIRFLDEKIERVEGLDYYVTGSAAVGHDYGEAVDQSLSRTEIVTYIMVVVILILIYRSPLAAIVPLLTILLSLRIAMSLVAVFAKHVTLIPTMVPVFMTVVLFGAGTNYCLFLVGRYKEELGRGLSYVDATRVAIAQVGRALGASAGTEVLGLVLLVFAEFDIFSRTGVAVGLSLIAALAASMTLAPAFFLVMRQKAFWPGRAEAALAGTLTTRVWRWVAAGVCRRPVQILVVALVLMSPFVYFGVVMEPSYDLFSELPSDMHARRGHDFLMEKFGTRALSEQLSAVVTGDVDFTSSEGLAALNQIVEKLQTDRDRVVEVRSLISPLGKPIPALISPLWWRASMLFPQGNVARKYADQLLDRYASKDRHSVKVDIVLKYGTFSKEAMDSVPDFRDKVRKIVAATGLPGTSAQVGGMSAYMNDLRVVTTHDLHKLVILVSVMVYVFLVWLMRDWFSPIYMLGTMVLSYLVTMGVADVVFHHIGGGQGLDWKVRFFLFVLLIAIGEDYNIYLMSRVREEALKHGMREGVRRAIIYTGSIISACGLIMAGTFGAMMAARVDLMIHIGFAMAFGILLDTFIIRPVIVPCIALIFGKLHLWHRDIVRTLPDDDLPPPTAEMSSPNPPES